MKKLLCVLLSVAMILGMLAGCGKKEESAETTKKQEETTKKQATEDDPYADVRISDEVITLTLAGPSGATEVDWNSSLQFAEYEKRLGLKFDATTYTNEQWDSKVTLMFASDELPDIIGCSNKTMSRSDVQKYGEDGYLLDLSKYLDIMPNFKAALEASEGFRKSVTLDNGAIYGITRYMTFGLTANYDYVIMSDAYLEKLGMERPETLDEFYDYLVAVKEQDMDGNGNADDEIPMAYAGKNRYYTELPIRYAFGVLSNNYAYMPYADEDGKVFAFDTTDNYKEFLRFMNKLYTEGLINQDCYVVDVNELIEKALAGQIGYSSQSGTQGASKEAQELNKWYQLYGLTNEGYQDERITVLSDNSFSQQFMCLVNANTKYPEEICKFIDYMFTDEGSLSGGNGYDGVTFDWNNVCGFNVCDHAKKVAESGLDHNTYRSEVLALGCFRFTCLASGTIYDLLNNVDYQTLCDSMNDLDGALFNTCTINAVRAIGLRDPNNKIVDAFPMIYYTDEETAKYGTLKTDVLNYLENAKAQFITGELDIDKDWDAYVKKVNEIGLDDLIAIEQAAYDRYTK